MNIEDKKADQQETATVGGTHPAWVWVSVLLALVAWAVLAWSNGYVAMGVSALAIAAGHSSLALKRLAITAIIAATVLLVVVGAYLIVLKVGLG